MTRLLAILLALFYLGNTAQADNHTDLDLANARVVSDKLTTGGQPTKADLGRLKEAGFTTVVNLRRDGETTKRDDPEVAKLFNFDEAEAASSIGLSYFHLPISSKDGLTAENAKLLDDALKAAPGPVLLHCGSGNRAGALLALRAYHVEGKQPDEALAIGKAAGLKSLEPKVRTQLGLPPLEE
ncbi:beta-lactamase hydrolase domain-containing protein [Kordiimonas lacus]|uniref:TIGR01244 family protein n=1 Tax=Kordiimonas lacus TaxID=637679 RepID=A0A1G7B3Z5_9PROT|nr:protein tyrosine phosphatase family protein [Kordiimonas lacus]SDE20955.1 TIGR01244 family protein [Kordiimonas lacus]